MHQGKTIKFDNISEKQQSNIYCCFFLFLQVPWMGYSAWVTNSQTCLSNLRKKRKKLIPHITTFLSITRLDLPEKAMAPHSSTLAWKIPWMEEPGRLQSMGSWRVGHDWATSLSLFTFMHWRRKWQPTPVLLPGESQGRWSLVDCRLWGRTESDTTEAT